MLKNINLRWKIMMTLVIVVPVFLGITLFQENIFIEKMREGAEKQGLEMAYSYANKIDGDMSESLISARAIARMAEGLAENKVYDSREVLVKSMKGFLQSNDGYLGTYICFEPNMLDGRDNDFKNAEYHNVDGRFVPWVYRDSGKLEVVASANYDKDNGDGVWYSLPRKTNREVVMEPWAYTIGNEKVLMVDMVVPMNINGKFIGVVGVDFPMGTIDKFVRNLDVFGSGYAFLVSNQGRYMAHPDNKKYVEGKLNFFDDSEISDTIKDGVKKQVLQGKVYTHYEETAKGASYFIFVPVDIGISKTPLILGLSIPMDEVLADARALRNKMLGIGVVGIFLIIGVIILISNSITKPLNETVLALESIADGDLKINLPANSTDEIGRMQGSVNNMAGKLAQGIAEIEEKHAMAEEKTLVAEQAVAEAEEAKAKAERAKAEGMNIAAERLETVAAHGSKASEQMLNQSEEIEKGSEMQRERMASTATAMEEMNATVLEVAKNAGETAEQVENSKKSALEGSRVINQTIESMGKIQGQTESLKENMGKLGQQAQDIGAVMNVIEDIADQTNLLALNAAIEAARAGEAGRGFAVVADEVRKLAEKTMGATKEVGESIGGIQKVAQDNISNMDSVVENITSATELSRSSGSVFDQIVTDVEISADRIQSIATASEQQSATSEEINRSIDDVNQIAMQTAEASAEASAAAEEMANQAKELLAIIDDMKSDS
ncbi:methyl-accepting chemotaxis protein [Maridesulfovibrio frigidus]|uniref:methyl-accepting chemotaxis protein n=1 Tax=Maridesulfovibrio frigidus TaxID=340956 RepID=UPI00068F6876|nr:methyl-accepting chemotaxis protein [Maridesulfovibrio frigidus]